MSYRWVDLVATVFEQEWEWNKVVDNEKELLRILLYWKEQKYYLALTLAVDVLLYILCHLLAIQMGMDRKVHAISNGLASSYSE